MHSSIQTLNTEVLHKVLWRHQLLLSQLLRIRLMFRLALFSVPMLLTLVGGSGCASKSYISAQDQSDIKTIDIAEWVDIPVTMEFYDLNTNPVINGRREPLNQSTVSIGLDAKQQMQMTMTQQGIDLQKMIREEIHNRLESTGRFEIKEGFVSNFSNATLNIRVNHFGLSLLTELRKELYPEISLDIWLKVSGNRQWIGHGEVRPSTPHNLGYDYETLIKDPLKLSLLWKKAIFMAVKGAVKDLLQ